jgi:hypothetical protein
LFGAPLSFELVIRSLSIRAPPGASGDETTFAPRTEPMPPNIESKASSLRPTGAGRCCTAPCAGCQVAGLIFKPTELESDPKPESGDTD